MRKKYTISFGKNRKRLLVGSWIGMCISVLSMTAGGIAAIEISRMWTRSYHVGTGEDTIIFHEEPYEEKTLGQISALIKNVSFWIEQEREVESEEDEDFLAYDAVADGSLTAEFVPIAQRKIDRRSPERLNYVFLFDEKDLKGNPMDSYAGRVYQELSERDGGWIRELYGLGQIPPEQMAANLGIDISGVSSWNRVKVTFRDGDGVPVSGSSNAKGIISMASVYAYFQQWDDYDSFSRYANMLWKKSHSYRISVSDRYYCEGECQYIEKAYPETGGESMEISAGAGVAEEVSETAGDIVGTEAGQDTGSESAEMLTDSEGVSMTETDMSVESDELSTTTDTDCARTDSGMTCTGHIDLDISVRITGLRETMSLYETDSVGNMEENFKGQWSGWDTEMRSYADNLADQDWYDLYGLFNQDCVYLRNPLSQSEIAFYMNKLPDTVSFRRRELIRAALESVGCIPYYWGGKPWGGGLEGNRFGTVIEPDEKGRILRGLDCSGWISWVYWTVFGNPLPAQSTSGLVSCGRGITKEELQAGDILIRTGEQPHVYLFLAWTEDGTMYLIHETTGNVNNVTVNTYNVEVTHYRDLIGEE